MKKIFSKKYKNSDFLKHETKQHVLRKFLLVLLLFLGYFFFIANKYGLEQGLLVTGLTWSFFVLCTPIADAGFLIDFPLRLITKIRMFISEIFVWIIAISLNIYTVLLKSEVYEKTKILKLFKYILENPFPFWIIIGISLFGTFVSIEFGDELIDEVKHKNRKLYHKNKHGHRFIIMIFIFTTAIILYDILLKKLGVNLPI